MRYMFSVCLKLYSLDVSHFNINNGVEIKGKISFMVNTMKDKIKQQLKTIGEEAFK